MPWRDPIIVSERDRALWDFETCENVGPGPHRQRVRWVEQLGWEETSLSGSTRRVQAGSYKQSFDAIWHVYLQEQVLSWWTMVGDRAQGEVWEQEDSSGSHCVSLMTKMVMVQSRDGGGDGEKWTVGIYLQKEMTRLAMYWFSGRRKERNEGWLLIYLAKNLGGGAPISWEGNKLEVG